VPVTAGSIISSSGNHHKPAAYEQKTHSKINGLLAL